MRLKYILLLCIVLLILAPAQAQGIITRPTPTTVKSASKTTPKPKKTIEEELCEEAGHYFLSNEYTKAFSLYMQLAEQGYAPAQSQLGYMYNHGMGVSQNLDAAIKWYQKSAFQGYSSAQYYLGHMYYKGEGVTRDLELARYWWQKAADQGDEQAKYWLQKSQSEN